LLLEGADYLKYTANLISLSRIALLVALFFTYKSTSLFVVIYLVCGLTDALDGYIARKTKTESNFGARLDTFADLLLFVVITASIILWYGQEVRVFMPWVITTALIRCVNIAIAAYKYRSFAILHTWGNKLTGFLLFMAPLFIILELTSLLWLACLAAIISAAEETVIHLSSPKLNLNRRSILTAK
jgi:phosphatidylglycerophosphate synthase